MHKQRKPLPSLLVGLFVVLMFLSACGSPPETTTTAESDEAASGETAVAETSDTAESSTAAEPVEESAPAEPKIITVASGANDPRSIDPQQAIDSREYTLSNLLFPGLVFQDEVTKEIAAAMAENWDISEDGTEYTFNLLQEIPWVRYNADTGEVEQMLDEEGNPKFVTAHDFYYGWQRALNPETASPIAYMLAPYVAGGEAYNSGDGEADAVMIEAVDDYAFKVTAPEKVAFLLGIYGLNNARATPEWAINESGDVWTEPENISSYGPFVLSEWVHEGSMTFVKNPFWPGSEGVQQAALDQITFQFIDAVTGLREYEAGNIDVSGVPADQVERLQADSTLASELTIVPGLCSQAWDFNTAKAPFDNVHIRRAFSYAVDREILVEDVLGGGEIPAPFFTPPGIALAPAGEDIGDLGMRYDPDKAAEELALGLADLGLASPADLPTIAVEFGTSPTLSAIAQALQVMWKDALDVEVELASIDNSIYWSKQGEDAGQIFRGGWCPDYNDANNYLRDTKRSDSIYNSGNWANEEFDALIDEARVLDDTAKRIELYTQAEQIMVVEDAATMPLYWPVAISISKPHVDRTFATTGVEAYWKWDISN